MGILRRRSAATHATEGERTARGRYPDGDVAAWTAYVAQSDVEVGVFDRTPLVVGQRRAWPRDKDIDVIPNLIVWCSPESAVRWWPARLFAVGSMDGLERRSFAAGSTTGWCRGYTVLEELPGHRSFGPGGEAAVAVAEHAARLDARGIRQLGDLARSVTPKPPLDAVRAARQARYGPGARWPEPRDTGPLSVFIDNAWAKAALNVDPEIGPGHLLDEFDGCVREWRIVDPVWCAAARAAHAAISAEVWADVLDGDVREGLATPWRLFLAG